MGARAKVKKHPHSGHAGPKREFIELVTRLTHDGHRRHSEVLDDFSELAFCAIAKTTHPPGSERAEALEARYMALVGKRSREYVAEMPRLLALTEEGLREPCDFLGEVAGELGALSDWHGQFFTPYSLARMMAEMTLGSREELQAIVDAKGVVDLGEPACGAGAMVLAVADVVDARGLDASRHLRVLAVDVSDSARRLAYVQLACRGVPAAVVHGSSLTLETFSEEVTPAMLRLASRPVAAPPPIEQLKAPGVRQLGLF